MSDEDEDDVHVFAVMKETFRLFYVKQLFDQMFLIINQ